MPQGNDLKDAKDIDPLGMTRDLFGQRPVDEAVTAAPGSQELQHPEDTHVGADDHAADNVSVGDDDDAARDDESLDTLIPVISSPTHATIQSNMALAGGISPTRSCRAKYKDLVTPLTSCMALSTAPLAL